MKTNTYRIMKNVLFSFLAICYSIQGLAQNEARLYLTLDDYINQKPTIKVLTIDKRSGGSIAMSGGSDYKVYEKTDKVFSKEIKKDYYLVERNDSLFVNMRHLGGSWYGLSFYRNNKYIFFVGAESKLQNDGAAASMFGVAGGLATAGIEYNYLIDLSDKSQKFLTPTFMKELLGENSVAYLEYKKEEYKYSTETILKYLNMHYHQKSK